MPDAPRYRIVAYERHGDDETVIMGADGDAFHAAVAVAYDGRMTGDHGVGGPTHLLEHLADLIAANPTGSSTR